MMEDKKEMYLVCPDCGERLLWETGLIFNHYISADGEHFIDDSDVSWSCRIENQIFCRGCGRHFVEGRDWDRDCDTGAIVLVK